MADIGCVGVNDGLIGGVGARCIVHVLLGYSVLLQERFVTISGDLGQFQIGLCDGQCASRLCQLLVDLRRLDDSQQIACFYIRTNIEVPLLEVAVGSRVDRRRDIRLDVAGQHDFLGRCSLLRQHH